jgi:hypothetical protein
MILLKLQCLFAFCLIFFFNFENAKPIQDKAVFIKDTLVGSKIITEEIAGSAYRKSAKGYFLMIGKDTSKFTCIFSESKEGNYISLEFMGKDDQTSYRERMEHLKIILPVAAKEYNMDSLKSIFLGSLSANGDIAIDVTNEYRKKFGTGVKIKKYSIISGFLEKSKLAVDINQLFQPYSISVKDIRVEKVSFFSGINLSSTSKIETKPASIGGKYLDCVIWVSMKR